MDKDLVDILACPKCKGDLTLQKDAQGVLCAKCAVIFPVREGVPIMLEDEAYPVSSDAEGKSTSNKSRQLALFEVQEGKNKGETVKLPVGTCKAIGRSLEDLNSTQIFSMDFTSSLDDFTKKVVMNYISKRKSGTEQNQKSEATDSGAEGLGSFKRLPDLVLNDPAISRLHAMIFHDENGAGVLDLVSRNGTFVNGQEVENMPLNSGDVIEIGGTKISVQIK